MEVVLLSVVLVGIAFVILGVNIFFMKGRTFPQTEVGKNKEMQRLGISCAKCDERVSFRRMMAKRKAKINPGKLKLDLG